MFAYILPLGTVMFKPLRTMWFFSYILKAFLIVTAAFSSTCDCCGCRWPSPADSNEICSIAVRVRTAVSHGRRWRRRRQTRQRCGNKKRKKNLTKYATARGSRWFDRSAIIEIKLWSVPSEPFARFSGREVTDKFSSYHVRPPIRWR